ncbi:recombinase [Oxobacter pfennigii]|uniref:Recombinase n=1 Tax=Oxobacter pfennigii TaxID=36849 RepID=A0A0P8WR38_9CLOT|nr:recombinase family protein [Oxobacter pfennigii]KPU45027.1 recombinase [Oxobacter pfennigii]
MQETTVWIADGYLRLSIEDKDKKDESNSIKNQRDLILDFLSRHPDIQVHRILDDDGVSGAHFDRERFKEMIRHIEAGLINCVIVKDFSRLGRDHIETGKYIERYFASKGVRFISVNDNYDSLTADDSDKLMASFKNICNEATLEDISVKTSSHLKVKRDNGELVVNFAVYGYLKTKDKQLIPDDYAADVVRFIFGMKIQGYNEQQIADMLNSKGILPPAAHKKALGLKYCTPFAVKDIPKWSVNAIKRILTNPVYIGTLEQGKRKKLSYRVKNKCIAVPREQWSVKEKRHVPIVDDAEFSLVGELMARDTRTPVGAEQIHMFSGIILCGSCQRPMNMRTVKKGGKEYIYFNCSTHKQDKSLCKYNNVSANILHGFLLHTLRAQIGGLVSAAEVADDFGPGTLLSRKQQAIEDMIRHNRQIIEQNNTFLVRAYEHYVSKVITESEHRMFKATFKQQVEIAEAAIAALERELAGLRDGTLGRDLVERFKKYQNLTELNREAVVSLVRAIVVHDSEHIDVHLRYSDVAPLAAAPADLETVREAG